MKKPIYIYGAGGLGREIAALLHALPEWNLAGYIDDKITAKSVIGASTVVGDLEYLNNLSFDADVVLALGNPLLKKEIRKNLENPRLSFPVIIHPQTSLMNRTAIHLEGGTIVCAGTRLTTNIEIGKHVLLNLNSTIGHDCKIGDYCSIMPGVNISGNVQLGKSVFIGSGTNIKNKICVGAESIIGMGSVVIRDIEARSTVAGVPAKPIRKCSSAGV
jgi:sugar O-acyltransferase (sialic acid O-acetyltransferase NeuD family)